MARTCKRLYHCPGCQSILEPDYGGLICPNYECAVVVAGQAVPALLASPKKRLTRVTCVIEKRHPAIIATHAANPCCYWCGVPTKLLAAIDDPDLATWDHLYSRENPRRNDGNKRLKVLSCRACNRDRVWIEREFEKIPLSLTGSKP